MNKPRTDDRPGLVDELRELGRQVGETLEATWNSQERKDAEQELRAGAKAFADEMRSVWERTRGSRPADVGSKARSSAAEGLRWMSAELADLADRFTAAEDADDAHDADDADDA